MKNTPNTQEATKYICHSEECRGKTEFEGVTSVCPACGCYATEARQLTRMWNTWVLQELANLDSVKAINPHWVPEMAREILALRVQAYSGKWKKYEGEPLKGSRYWVRLKSVSNGELMAYEVCSGAWLNFGDYYYTQPAEPPLGFPYKVKCSNCGEEWESPHNPIGTAATYCAKCGGREEVKP